MSSKISDLIDKLNKESEKESSLTFEEIYKTFGRRTYGPFIFLMGLIALSPIGAIPGVGVLTGFVCLLFALQYFFLESPWLPQSILKVKIPKSKFDKGLGKAMPYIKKIEKYVKPRLLILIDPPFNYAAILMVILLSCAMIILAPVPWAITLPALALTFIGIANVVQDGIFMLFGWVFSLGSFYLIYQIF